MSARGDLLFSSIVATLRWGGIKCFFLGLERSVQKTLWCGAISVFHPVNFWGMGGTC